MIIYFCQEFPEGFRAALSLRGIETGTGRQPQSPSQQLELNSLRDKLQCLLSSQGFTDEPLGGCPSGSHVDSEQVARIVRQVVDRLQDSS